MTVVVDVGEGHLVLAIAEHPQLPIPHWLQDTRQKEIVPRVVVWYWGKGGSTAVITAPAGIPRHDQFYARESAGDE